MSEPDQDLDELLRPAAIPPKPELREHLLRQTLRRVRSGRGLRRSVHVAVLAAVFGAGLVVRGWIDPPTAPVVASIVVQVNAPKEESLQSARYVSPAELEQEAEQINAKAEAAQRFREAGDRYLAELGDLRGALRCYRNFLDEAAPADLAVTETDNWLLASLKRDRRKEFDDANVEN